MVEPWLECQVRPRLERRVRIAIPALRRDRMQLEEPSIHQLLIDAPRSKPCGPSPPASHGSEFRRHRRISQIQMPATQTVAAIFLFAPHIASRPARLYDGGIVPRRKAIRCTMKRTPLNHAGRRGRDLNEDIPRNGERTAQSITNLRTNRELVGASTAPLPLPRQAFPSLLDKIRRFRGVASAKNHSTP